MERKKERKDDIVGQATNETRLGKYLKGSKARKELGKICIVKIKKDFYTANFVMLIAFDGMDSRVFSKEGLV